MIVWIEEACAAGARRSKACAVLEIAPRTLQRWRAEGEVKVDGRKAAGARRRPANRLSESERERILEIANQPAFASLPASDDNPYSESLFKTLKYHPGFPNKPFDDLHEARTWVAGFVEWYNEVHQHSALRFVTPGQRHRGEDIVILAQRETLYQEAKAQHPERWSGPTRKWTPVGTVYLNPGMPRKKKEKEVLITQNTA